MFFQGSESKGILNKRTLATTPPLTGHPSIEGNYFGASRGKGKNRRPGFIPLYGGVLRTANTRSAGVVRAPCHSGAASCLIYYRNSYKGRMVNKGAKRPPSFRNDATK
jgi:hypothetical protein